MESSQVNLTQSLTQSLTPSQAHALEVLQSGDNVFLTGGAGCGKSFVLKQMVKSLDFKTMPLLASTGAAAVLIGGRTFHSFFGIGIIEGGFAATFDRAMADKRLLKRLKKVEGVIIDEVSMLSGEVLELCETISRHARKSDLPWGGMRVVIVGDFAQLPPVKGSFCFENPVWEKSNFQVCHLQQNIRVQDNEYLSILNKVRIGLVDCEVTDFLNSRVNLEIDNETTRLFPRREQVSDFNRQKLDALSGGEIRIPSIYYGSDQFVEGLKKSAPVPEELILKIGCLVMIVQNDPGFLYVNGSKGLLREVGSETLLIELENRRLVSLTKTEFNLLNAEGHVMAGVVNFPINLAWATTIHKSQGATLTNLAVDLTRLWEPGQAYVAMSRLRKGNSLHVLGWTPNSFRADPKVTLFYNRIAKVDAPLEPQ